MRRAAAERDGRARLQAAAVAGAPPCSIAAAAFEACWDTPAMDPPAPWIAGVDEETGEPITLDPEPPMPLAGRCPLHSGPARMPRHPDAFKPGARLSARWARRLEWAVAYIDARDGQGAAMRALLSEIYGHKPDLASALKPLGAPRGAIRRHGAWIDQPAGPATFESITVPNRQSPYPVTLAFFVQRLYRRAKLRRTGERGSLTWDQRRTLEREQASREARIEDIQAQREAEAARRRGTARYWWED